ncbi:MAG TPA: hypothetical protein VFC42_04730 [Methylomirabilota bacterium]|nr:hypothetical protein [Methylomirabilota bacterium]
MPRIRRGRPLKFGRPAQLVALTLPQDVLRGLRRIHPDPAWAIVLLFERATRSGQHHVRPRSGAPAELAQLSPSSALIVVDPRSVPSLPGVSVIRVAPGRAFLAFEEGRGLADLELGLVERLGDAKTSRAMRKELAALHRHVRSWRRARHLRLAKRSIILVERAGAASNGRRGGR